MMSVLPMDDSAVHNEKVERRSSNIFMRLWNGWTDGVGGFVALLSRGSGSMGAFISRRPWISLLISAAVTILICIGFLRIRTENEADVLWVPQSGRAQDDKKYVQRYFVSSTAGGSFYAQLNPHTLYGATHNQNALQIPVTWEMFYLHNLLMNMTVKSTSGASVSFSDICYQNAAGSCATGGYLSFWNRNFTQFLQSIGGSSTDPTQGNVTAFQNQVSQLTYPDGSEVSFLSVYGGTTFGFTPTFQILSAEVIASDYELNHAVNKDTVNAWNDAMQDTLAAAIPKLNYTTITYITGQTVGEELSKSINGDLKLVAISAIVYVVVAVILLTKLDWVKTRTCLALAAMIPIAGGMVSGWCWGFIFGEPFTPLQELSPFILLGMGIDVLFILVKAYDIIVQHHPGQTLEQYFRALMGTSGLSVIVTLLASAVAFAFGAVTELNSVRWFSIHATMNTIMIMALMVTFFIAMFVINERRAARNYIDCCCYPPCARDPPTVEATVLAMPIDTPGLAPLIVTADKTSSFVATSVSLEDHPDENMVKYFFRKYYGPFLSHWAVKVVVIAIFVGYGIASFFGIYRLKYGQPLEDLAPDGSYLQAYARMASDTYDQQVGSTSNLYFRNLDFAQPSEQAKMLRALDMTLHSTYVNASTSVFLGNWLVSFTEWVESSGLATLVPGYGCYNPYAVNGTVQADLLNAANPQNISGCIPYASFYPLFQQWIAGAGASFKGSFVSSPGGNTIMVATMPVMHTAPGNDDKYSSNAIRSVRDLEASIWSQLFSTENAANPPYVAFLWNSDYINWEGDEVLPHMALEYFLLALGGVGIVMLLMLVNPLASILMMCQVGLTDLFLFGELWILNIKFNQVSIINMIMATGLAIDYSVYFAQKFMTVEADGTRNGRMKLALAETGSSVFFGGFTALCGTVPMAFAQSTIIRTFFFLIFGTIVFSLLIGLMLGPVVFSLIGPPAIKSVLIFNNLPAKREPKEELSENGKEVA